MSWNQINLFLILDSSIFTKRYTKAEIKCNFKVVSSITASLRFDGAANLDLRQIKSNLVPYPRIHFPLITYAPFLSKENPDQECNSVTDLTEACLLPDNQMIMCDRLNGRNMTCLLLYRGDIAASDVNNTIKNMKENK